MTDLLFQGSTRQAVLDDLALALPLETVGDPSSIDGADDEVAPGNIQHILGDGWRILIVWMDTYQSGLKDGLPDVVPVAVPETKVARGLHANFRVGGPRAEEIEILISDHFALQTKSARNWGDKKVWQARGKDNAGQVRKTANGTCWLQTEDPDEDGFIADRSAVFA